MHISARADYAMRAVLVLAEAGAAGRAARPVKAETIATAQGLPGASVEAILGQLKRSGLVLSTRGPDGGHRLVRSPSEITVADVIRAVDGPLADVRGLRPEDAEYEGAAAHLVNVWIAARAALRTVVEVVTIADILDGTFPLPVAALIDDPDSWKRRERY